MTNGCVYKSVRKGAVFWLFFSLSTFLFAQNNLKFKRLTNNEGLSQNSVYSVIQDNEGFIWMTTENGLNKFDGYHFTTFTKDPNRKNSITGNFTWPMIEDQSGTIWVGTYGKGFSRFDKKTERFYNFVDWSDHHHPFENNAIWAMLPDGKDHLWIGTFGGGMKLFDKKKGKFLQRYSTKKFNSKGLAGDDIRTIIPGKKNQLWLGTFDGGLGRFNTKTKKFTHYKHSPEKIICLYDDLKHGYLWIGTHGNGLWKMNKRTGQFIRCKRLGHDFVRAIQPDPNQKDRLWIATWRGGLADYRISKGATKFYANDPNDPNSISDNQLLSLTIDRAGLLWVGTYNGGVNYFPLRHSKFKTYAKKGADVNGLTNDIVYSILERKDELWFATNGGGLNRINNSGKIDVLTSDPKSKKAIAHNLCYFILADQHANYWIGTNSGVNRFSPSLDNIQTFLNDSTNPTSISYDACPSGYLDKSGTLWFGTFGEGINKYNYKTNDFTRYKNDKNDPTSLSNNTVFTFFEDSKNRFWVGTSEGGLNLMNRKTGKFQRMMDPSLGQGVIVYGISEDKKGRIWVATSQGLVCMPLTKVKGNAKVKSNAKVKGNAYRSFTKKDGLADNYIAGVIATKNGDVWVSTLKGICQLHLKNNASLENPKITNYSVKDGLLNCEFAPSSFHKGASGHLYFGGVGGCVSFHPDSMDARGIAPQIAITKMEIFNRSVALNPSNGKMDGSIVKKDGKHSISTSISITKHITLPYSDNVFSLSFAAMDYYFPTSNHFKYKLEGFDPIWNDNGTNNQVTYTNLNPGDYTFKVKGTNSEGVWSEPYSLEITITPPWWQTWWFRISGVVIIIISIYAYIKNRIQKLIKEKIQLEQKVEERTLEINQQKQEIESQATELQHANEELIKLDELKQRMTSMIVHDLKNPLNSIVNLSQHDEQSSNLPVIEHSAKQMLNLVMNILDLQHMQSSEIQIQKKPHSLLEIVNRALAYVHLSIIQKNCPVEIKISESAIVICDATLIERVIINILANAIYYSPINEAITITGTFLSDENEPKITLSISDKGKGISQERIAELLTDSGKHEKGEDKYSTGIGLQYCKLVLDAHASELQISSELSKGSTFQFVMDTTNIQPTDKSEKTITNTSENFQWSENELSILCPMVQLMINCEVYEGSKILVLLEEITDSSSQITSWKVAVKQAVYSVNQARYDELLADIK